MGLVKGEEETILYSFIVDRPISLRNEQFTFEVDRLEQISQAWVDSGVVELTDTLLPEDQWFPAELGVRIAAMLLLSGLFSRVVIERNTVLLRATKEAWMEEVDGKTLLVRAQEIIARALDPSQEIPFIKREPEEKKSPPKGTEKPSASEEGHDPWGLRD